MKNLVKLEEKENIQYINFNGVNQTLKNTQVHMICPCCNKVIRIFNEGVNKLQALKYISDELNQEIKYCLFCGQELEYPYILEVNKNE